MKYAIIIVIAVIAALITFLILFLPDKKRTNNNSQIYLQNLTKMYEEHTPIIECLSKIEQLFKSGSIEYIAVEQAIFYLTKSIMRDYETAFSIIEKVFRNQEVKKLHADIIEKEKANVIYLLQ